MRNPEGLCGQLGSLEEAAAELLALLSERATVCPDLESYLRAHGELLAARLDLNGSVYSLWNGEGLTTVLTLPGSERDREEETGQREAFEQAALAAVHRQESIVLPPEPFEEPASASAPPVPGETPLFNRTAWEHHFVPIPSPTGEGAAGVLHGWFAAAEPEAEEARQYLLAVAASALGKFVHEWIGNRGARELTVLQGEVHFLAGLLGELERGPLVQAVVHYAREASGCERVLVFRAPVPSLLPGGKKGRAEGWGGKRKLRLVLEGCSGVHHPNPRSEQARQAERVARRLVGLAEPRLTRLLIGGEARREEHAAGHQGEEPALAIGFAPRETGEEIERPEEIAAYFDSVPMEWVAAVWLPDSWQRICGILLLEGRALPADPAALFVLMRRIARAAGRALGASLRIEESPALRRAWARPAPSAGGKRLGKSLRAAAAALGVAALLVMPVPLRIKGEAVVRSGLTVAVPALVSARVESVRVGVGERVERGDLLLELDGADTLLKLREAEQEYRRNLSEADLALSLHKDAQMQAARLSAQKAAAAIQRLAADYRNTRVRAPISGLILGPETLFFRKGQVVPFGETLVELADPSRWEVKVSLREQDLDRISRALAKSGRPLVVRLRLQADPTRSYRLVLSRASELRQGIHEGATRYEFGLLLPWPSALPETGALKSGMRGVAAVEMGWRPVAELLFRDFWDFVRLHWL
ncbi:MAG: HlyD family efflux transporter periplasmic adaptor subunit [Methylacidiphilaceae bacterium]|nr:HlyD family efflux transporter periplasmic adaptor subunit [Candidatus Methylacidiphilaceae bacterium]